MFCPGGNPEAKNYAPDSQKGLRLSCVKAEEVNATNTLITTTSIQRQGLTTKTTRAKRFVDCVTLPGFYLKTTSPATQEAAPCRRNTYSPGYSRLRQCLRCQSGTAENPGAGFADVDGLQPGQYPDKASLRTDRLKVCQVPPGGYLSQNVVRDCPPGSFRGSFTYTTETASRYCFSCPAGLTTSKARATLPSDCNIVGAGVLFTQDTIAQAIALATTTPAGEAPDNSSTTPCSYGSYFPGGPFVGDITCLPCPLGSTTKGLGATSPNDCMVPPGYFIQLDAAGAATGKMVKCPENADGQGYFRAGWVRFDDENVQEAGSGTTACSSCGKGIKSALTDVDEALGGTDTAALVAGSSFSCYIETGWGMMPTGVVKADYTMEFAATVCDKNTYGVANTTFGLQATPCKPCARNLITLQAGSTDPSQCVNPGGYGYTPTGANRCAVGSYTSLASLGACMPCPEGRTTADDAAKQTSIADCFVQPGHGIVLPDCQPSVNSSPDAGATPPIDPTFICEADNEGSHDCSSGHCNCKNEDSCSGGGKKNCTWMPSGPDKKEGTCCKGKPSLGRRLLQLPTDACAAALAALNDTQLASVCAACDAGTTTQREGSTSKDECNKCKPGYGKQPGSADCTKCITGTYQAGFAGNEDAAAHGNGETCIACPTTLSIFLSSKGKEAEFKSNATTFRSGSTGEEECVPQTVQVGVDVGSRIFEDAFMQTAAGSADLPACLSNCAAESCCFVQFDYGHLNRRAASCSYLNLEPSNNPWAYKDASAALLFQKLPPSGAIAAASIASTSSSSTVGAAPSGSVRDKTMSSGLYARCNVADVAAVGRSLGITYSLGTGYKLSDCKHTCDMMSTCFGFTVHAGECSLRGGFDAADVRTFFNNPAPATITSLFW